MGVGFVRFGVPLHLLDSDQLEYAFALHGISREAQARAFYADLWDLIQKGERTRTDLELSRCGGEVRRLCKSYFSLMRQWQEEEEEKYENEEICTASRDNMREARQLLTQLEKSFSRYALCYLELNRALIQSRANLSAFVRDYEMDKIPDSLIVNHGTGALLQRAHRDYTNVLDKKARLEQAAIVLAHLDPLMEFLAQALPDVLGSRRGDQELTQFKGALRSKNYPSALKISRGWRDVKLSEAGSKIAYMVRENENSLQARDAVLLHSGELKLVEMSLASDEAKFREFLNKYNVPYMVFQYRILLHQGVILGRIGSIEGLIIAHAKLLALSARGHNDPDLARAQQQAVLIPARAVVQQNFKTLTPVFDTMETTLAILEKLFIQTREYLRHLPA